jgi:hypothetical protein
LIGTERRALNGKPHEANGNGKPNQTGNHGK